MNNRKFNKTEAWTQADDIHEWILSFLKSDGNNPVLAETLGRKAQYHYGPVDYPLDKLVNNFGADTSFKFHELQADLDLRVSAMLENMKTGWKPAPLIVTNLWEDYFEIADGAHRHKALQVAGIKKYPTVFYFKDQASLDNFIRGVEEDF